MNRATHSNPTHSLATILSGYFSLIRPLNAIMAALGVYIGYALSTSAFVFNTNIAYAILAVIAISGGGQAVNDYFDYAIDKQKKSTRALARGIISRTHGLIFGICLFALGIILSSFLSTETFWMSIFFSALLFLYSATMSTIKFVGNVIVALSVAFTFIFGASLTGITPLILMIALAAFLANWTREIVKDMEDKDADKGHKVTLPLIMKAEDVKKIVYLLLALTLIAGYLPTYAGEGTPYYTALVTMANVIFILAGKHVTHGRAAKAQSTLKKGMLIALLAQISLLV